MTSVVDRVPSTTTPGRCTKEDGWQTFKVCGHMWRVGCAGICGGLGERAYVGGWVCGHMWRVGCVVGVSACMYTKD